MSQLFNVSATIKAEQLSRVNQENYCLDELIEHRNKVQETYFLLLSIESSGKKISRNERANISNWIKRIFLILSRSNDLIQIAKIQEDKRNNGDDSDETSIKDKKNSSEYFNLS